MSSFTYEKGNICTPLETYEWDNTWIDQANNKDTPRVLYIGDSISCGIRRIATERSGGKLLFDGFGSSKALDNPYLYDAISLLAAQEGCRRVVLFNNGLHGWHLEDTCEYLSLYEKAVEFMTKRFSDSAIVLVLTTSVQNDEREKRVIVRNEAVNSVAKKYGLPVIDLYTVSKKLSSLHSDGVHFIREGYEGLADKILTDIKKLI